MKLNQLMMILYLILILMISSTLEKKLTLKQVESAISNSQETTSVDNASNDQFQSNSSSVNQIHENVQNIESVSPMESETDNYSRNLPILNNSLNYVKNIIKQQPEAQPQLVNEAVLYNGATNWNEYGPNGPINFLDRHFVSCYQSNSALNNFKMWQREKQKNALSFLDPNNYEVRFTYTCVKSPQISNNCQTLETPVQDANFIVEKSLDSLTRHYVTCPKNTVMKDFVIKTVGRFDVGIGAILRLGRDDRPRIFYKYTCCDANVSREIYAKTQKSYGGDNEYYNLKNQFIDAKDFNAISSFNMQSPPNEIFYYLRFSTLKGEKSLSFPDPCEVDANTSSSTKSFLGNKS